MSRAAILQPNLVLGKTIFGLTPEILEKYHLKGLILDVDETLIPLTEAQVSPQLQQWVETIRQSTTIWLVSNNISQNRISRIGNSLDLPYLLGALKPSRRKLKLALAAMNLPPSQVAMVGDRLFTDVLAGNRLGLFTILVEPMIEPGINSSFSSLRNFEVWLSELLGVSLQTRNIN